MAETTKKSKEKIRTTFLKDNGKYKDDIIVGINGRFTQVQRGVPVELDEDVYAVIQNSMTQDGQTANLIEEKKREFKNGIAEGVI